MRHVPALDGLRGGALLGVLFFHAKGALPGGYLGVDLFFVLSGFLITSLLLDEHRRTGSIALSQFWVRRARRLFPALLSLMPAIAIYGRVFATPDALAGLRADALATLGYVANWRAIFTEKSYWELFLAPSPLEHTWSLSIEEQFYVVWPLLALLLLRVRGRRAFLGVTIALTLASMIAMLVLFDPAKTSRAYLGTDTRAAAILAGAILAMVLPIDRTFDARTVKKLDVAGILAALGLAVAWCKLDGQSPFLYRGGFWLTQGAALVLIACAVAGPSSLVARALSVSPLRGVGTISYGLYLWHWPVNVVLTEERIPVGRWIHLVQFAVTFAVAIVSYHLLEQPIRKRGIPFGRPVFTVPAAVILCIALVVRGTHARASAVTPTKLALVDGGPAPAVTEPVLFRVMLLGDSTANSLGWGIRGVQQRGLAVDLMGKDGCTMLADMCEGAAWPKYTADLHPNATLVFLGGAFLHGVTEKGRWQKSCNPAWDGKFEGTLTRRLSEVAALESKVWAVTLPYPLGPYDDATFRSEVDCINRSIRTVARAVPGVEVLDLAERLCPSGSCERESGGFVIRPDGVHYTVEGANALSRWILEQIQRVEK